MRAPGFSILPQIPAKRRYARITCKRRASFQAKKIVLALRSWKHLARKSINVASEIPEVAG